MRDEGGEKPAAVSQPLPKQRFLGSSLAFLSS
jgi:hypothetical protein